MQFLHEGVTEKVIISHLRELVSECKVCSIPHVILKLFEKEPNAKEFIKASGNTTISIMRSLPTVFCINEIENTVSIAEDCPLFTIEEIARHCSKDDAWIVVDGIVYDITEFVRTHWGWTSAGDQLNLEELLHRFFLFKNLYPHSDDYLEFRFHHQFAGKSSTIIAIMNALGTDCSRDFLEVFTDSLTDKITPAQTQTQAQTLSFNPPQIHLRHH
jgi:predicted heme/steroid binding protein